MKSTAVSRTPDIVLHGLMLFSDYLAASGLLLILYGLVSALTHEPWPPLERFVQPVSSTLTLIATAMTAASVFLYGMPPEPTPIGKRFMAPLVLLAVSVALYCVWTIGIPQVVVNGFSVLGLAGALMRIVPRPSFFQLKSN